MKPSPNRKSTKTTKKPQANNSNFENIEAPKQNPNTIKENAEPPDSGPQASKRPPKT